MQAKVISRRRILSRSKDELTNFDGEEDEDVWFQKDKLCRDHIHEILRKWDQIDDEIWGKIICMERNRRVAKAYARASVLTINGSVGGFDGYRIGLCGFENPLRDPRTEEVKRHIGHGVKLKMDEAGNIIVKRISRTNVFVKDMGREGEHCLSPEVTKLGGQLELDRPIKLFDMKLFQQNMSRELQRAYPDRRKLECQCIVAIAFVKDTLDLLDLPCWLMVINIVALDLLKSKFPLGVPKRRSVPNISSIFDNSQSSISEEDPYSDLVPSGLYAGLGELREMRPPKLPPRDLPVSVPKPDYEDDTDDSPRFSDARASCKKQFNIYDDPYYCGLSARVPTFLRQRQDHPLLRKAHSGSFLGMIRPQDSVPDWSSSRSGTEGDYARVYSPTGYYGVQQRRDLLTNK